MAYHMGIAREGSYLGFDRFGLGLLHPDEERVASLAKLIAAGAGDRVVVSHDSVWCWRGQPFPPELEAAAIQQWNPIALQHTHRARSSRTWASPISRSMRLLIDNPRRFFAGDKLAALS